MKLKLKITIADGILDFRNSRNYKLKLLLAV